MVLITSNEVIDLAFSSVEQITPGIIKETKIEAAQSATSVPRSAKCITR